MKLVIAEKPSVAKSIAAVIGADQSRDGYLEGNGYLVSWCYGHLIELAQPDGYGEVYKQWNFKSLPIFPGNWKYVIKKDTKSQFQILKNLMNDQRVTSVVCATDAGREGELIFRLVYNATGCRKPMERLWISSMEESAIREGFRSLRQGKEYDSLFDAALCRQESDWLVGINGTRLLTVMFGGRKVLKMGRVQTPTLAMIVARENKIKNFQSQSSYAVQLKLKDFFVESERFEMQEAAEKLLAQCMGKEAIVESVKKEKKTTAPPKLYDLTSLQRDANRLFGFTAKETLDHTQSLYEKKLVTYPRTDSQYLSEDMEDTAAAVINAIFQADIGYRQNGYRPEIKKLLDSSKVTDHHAVIPTVQIAQAALDKLSEGEKKILLLVANRLICAAGARHQYETAHVVFDCGGCKFYASGKTVLQEGWKEIEKGFLQQFRKGTVTDSTEELEDEEPKLPFLREGQQFLCESGGVCEHKTAPPKHYTEDSLLAAMERAGADEMEDDVERKGLGTPATRADIIDNLVSSGYIERSKKSLLPTSAGVNLIAVVPDNFKSAELTAEWENALALVARGEYSREEFMSGIRKMISTMVTEAGQMSPEEREQLAALVGGEEKVLGTCPKCGSNVVPGKFGAYCTGKCGMQLKSALGKTLTEGQVSDLLSGKQIFLKDIKSKNGKTYDAYLYTTGIEEFSYKKEDGTEVSGTQYKFNITFPKGRKRK